MRAENAQDRLADRINAFSGSMLFVYIHVGRRLSRERAGQITELLDLSRQILALMRQFHLV
jgi:hypothetical protein